MEATLTIVYNGKNMVLTVPDNVSLSELKHQIWKCTGATVESQKLMIHGKLMKDDATLREVDLKADVKVHVIGSTADDIAALLSLNTKNLVQNDLDRPVTRKRVLKVKGFTRTQQSDYKFLRFAVLPQFSNSSEAMNILTTLASDMRVKKTMEVRRWTVGSLEEMYPEQKIGQFGKAPPPTLLGLNVNKGQKILLRLRTDDLIGFRALNEIYETLMHELTHMVWSEHDDNFYNLNRELLRTAPSFVWQTASRGHAVGGGVSHTPEVVYEPEKAFQGGSHVLGGAVSHLPANELAYRAAALRLSASEERIRCGCSTDPHGAQVVMEEEVEEEEMVEELSTSTTSTTTSSISSAASSSSSSLATTTSTSSSGSSPSTSSTSSSSSVSSTPATMHTHAPPPASTAVSSLSSSLSSSSAQSSSPASSSSWTTKAPLAELMGMGFSETEAQNALQRAGSSLPGALELLLSSSDSNSSTSVLSAASDSTQRMVQDLEARSAKLATTIQALKAEARSSSGPRGVQEALGTLSAIITNVLTNPSEQRFRRVRIDNKSFHNRVGRFPQCQTVMESVGWSQDSTQPGYLVLKRDDPGLLWLAKSVLDNAANEAAA